MSVGCMIVSIVASVSSTQQHSRVIIVGVDGMTFDLIDPMVAAGELPTIAALLEEGARATLRSERPMRSPALWTTLATGQPRAVHRVYDFVTGSSYWPKEERGGEQRLVTSQMRAAPALWQMVNDAGRRAMVVGWLNTWPAEPIDGLMVAPYVALGRKKQTSIKGKIYLDAKEQTHPPEAFGRLKELVLAANQVDPQLIGRLIDEPPPGSPLYTEIPRLRRYLYTVRWSIASTLTNTAIIERELNERNIDLVMTYFDGADTLAHRFWLMREEKSKIEARLRAHDMDPKHADELKRRLGRAVEGYYQLVDEMLARILDAAGPNTTIFLISDHGWGSSPHIKALHESVPFDGEHRLDGIFVAAGPNIEHGRFDTLTLYDVAPTVLYVLGIGVPRSLPGRVALEIMDDQFAKQHPPLVLADKTSPATKPPAETKTSHFEEEELERLRSLGYVQ